MNRKSVGFNSAQTAFASGAAALFHLMNSPYYCYCKKLFIYERRNG